MDNPTIRDSVGFQLIHAGKRHRNYFTEALEALGLQGGEELVLAQLSETDGISQSELADALIVEPPTITALVKRLESDGFVNRRQDPDDARAQQVFLTDRGRELIEPIETCWSQGEEALCAGFTTEERLLFRRMLMEVRENLGESDSRIR